MTYVKKLKSEWNPQEHPGIVVGDVIDFGGNIEALVREESVCLCDENGNEISAYDVLGEITNRELEEFKIYKENLKQTALRKSLEADRETLLAQAKEVKADHKEKKERSEEEKKAFGAKMAAARLAAKQKKEAEAK